MDSSSKDSSSSPSPSMANSLNPPDPPSPSLPLRPFAPSRVVYSDRFIPSRSSSNLSFFDLPSPPPPNAANNAYTSLRSVLFSPEPPERIFGEGDFSLSVNSSSNRNQNIFRYKTEVPRFTRSPSGFQDAALSRVVAVQPTAPRKVPRSPYKVMDAPGLQEDYHLNLVDWSSNNLLAVGLGSSVYVMNLFSSTVTELCDLGVEDSICSVGWAQWGTNLAIGTDRGKVQIWDVARCRRVRTLSGHQLRVGALAWSSSILSSGGGDKVILHRDIRSQEDSVSRLTGHKFQICTLKWSCDNRQLASGGDDNKLFVWNLRSTESELKYTEHTGSVKAIAWSPHRDGILASGGWAADRCIRFWNTTTNTHLSCIDTGNQVSNVVWSKNVNELVSTHGCHQNQVVWKYPSMSKLATLNGHAYGVLYAALSPRRSSQVQEMKPCSFGMCFRRLNRRVLTATLEPHH